MGIRVAKFSDEDVWVVYQSVNGALYEPILHDELSAWLYAHYAYILSPAPVRFEYKLGEEIQRFVKLAYGGEDNFDEGEVYIDECSDVTCGTNRGRQILDELWHALKLWQEDPHAPILVRQFHGEGD